MKEKVPLVKKKYLPYKEFTLEFTIIKDLAFNLIFFVVI